MNPLDIPDVDPIALATLVGVDITNVAAASNGKAAPPVDTNAREVVDPIPPPVQDELDDDTGDQSKDTYRVICMCIDCGLNLAQTRWVVDQRPAMADRVAKFLRRRPPVDDVLISYTRALDEWQRKQPVAAAPSPGPQAPAAGPQTAAAGPQAAAAGAAAPGAAPPPSPGRFFGRTGLRARDLTDEVMQTVVCGLGRPDKQLYVYDNGVWTPNDGRIEAEVARILGNRYRGSHASTVVELVGYTPGIPIIADKPLREFVNVLNGVVDWRTGDLLPHDPDYHSTVQLPVEFDPQADCPDFKKFVTEVLSPDLYEPTADSPGFIWELIGYAICSGNPLHCAVLLFGGGRNGKGTVIRVLKVLLGEHNCSSVALHELVDNKFRAATLFRKLANLAGDLDAKWLESTALFKKITGNDSIQAEHKYGKPFDFTPWALPFYSTNKAFGSADSSEGWMDRWIVVPFPMNFTGREDRDLDAKLQTDTELRGILAKGIAALPFLIARGGFATPQSLLDAKAAFIVASDSVRAFVDECFDLNGDPAIFLPRTKVWELYCWYVAGDNPKTKLSARELYNRIGQISGITPHKRYGDRGFTGIGTKPGVKP